LQAIGMVFSGYDQTFIMKKVIPLLVIFLSAVAFSAKAQETKTKPVTTPADKVHNLVHPKKKISHGTKYKHKTPAGKKQVVTVRNKETEPLAPKKKTN
jgi:hypothetical protein